MSKDIMMQSTNKINVSGKLLDATFGDGTLNDGRHYKRATITVRTTQTYGGREETSEIPVSMFAAQYTQANKPNPGYKQIEDLQLMKTAQNVGIDEADTVRITGANIRENNFVSRNSGQLINGWQINTSFVNSGAIKDVASFTIDIFILDMHPEEDRNGEPTGRLVIKGGIVEGRVVNSDELKVVATLPNKEGLLSMLLGCLTSPVVKFACAVQEIAKAQEQE